MKKLLLIIFFVLIQNLFATNNIKVNDKILQKKIIGLWSIEFKGKNNYVYGENLYKKDGTFFGKGKMCRFNECMEFNFISKWKIDNSYLSSQVIKSSIPDRIGVGSKERDKIHSISDNKLIKISSLSGNKLVFTKINKSKFIK